MTDTLKVGDKVLTSRSTVKPARVRKNGEAIPERIVTVMREGKLLRAIMVGPRACEVGGWIVEWRDAANRKRTDTFFAHEVTKIGTTPLFLKADK